MTVVSRGALATCLTFAAVLGPAFSFAQQPVSTSADAAKSLAAALDAAKMDSVAASDPSQEGVFIGALYFPGLELLVVSAKYAVPVLLTERIQKKEYRDVYLDLNGASDPSTKVFIEDLGANGLMARPDREEPADVYEMAGKRVVFDRDWRAQNMSEDDYVKAYTDADARYAAMLKALLAQAQRAN